MAKDYRYQIDAEEARAKALPRIIELKQLIEDAETQERIAVNLAEGERKQAAMIQLPRRYHSRVTGSATAKNDLDEPLLPTVECDQKKGRQMIRFSIRELLLVTLVVALGVAWRLDHNAIATEASNYKTATKNLRYKLNILDEYLKELGFEVQEEGNDKSYTPPLALREKMTTSGNR